MQEKINIIFADDDPDDQFFFDAAIKRINAEFNVVNIKTGEELMDWLLNESVILPDILFLDLNMPLKSGLECLREIKSNTVLRNIVVAIYTTSTSPIDVQNTYERGANLFINKPNTFNELIQMLQSIFEANLKNGAARPELKDYLAYSTLPRDLVFKFQEMSKLQTDK